MNKKEYSILQPIKLENKKSSYDNLNVSFTRSVRGNNLLTINETGDKFVLHCGTWLEDKYTFVPNRRGGSNLIYRGFLYTTERKYNSTINWVCNKNSNTSLRCPARCVTAGENTIKLGLLKRRRPKNYTVIDNYRFVISSQSTNTYYLKCANFRKSCRARAIIRKDTKRIQIRDGAHNHAKHLQHKTFQIAY